MSSRKSVIIQPKSRTWQNHVKSTTEALRYMMREEHKTNVSVGHDRLAHKLVLAMWSPVLAKTLMDKGSKVQEVCLSDSPKVTDIMLKYMYGSISKKSIGCLPTRLVVKLHEAAHLLSMWDLRKTCVDIVESIKITTSNVVDLLDVSLRVDNETKVQKCKDFISKKGFSSRSLDPRSAPMTVFEILMMKKVCADCESKLLKLAISWLTHRDNRGYKYSALSFIDLASINWKSYQSIVRDHSDFFTEPEIAKILLCVAKWRTDELVQHFAIRTTTEARHDCSSCSQMEVNVSSFLKAKKRPKIRNLKDAAVEFGFTIFGQRTVRLAGVELNFGPSEVSAGRFKVLVKVRKKSKASKKLPPRHTIVDVIQRGQIRNYVVLLSNAAELKTGDSLTVVFKLYHCSSAQLQLSMIPPTTKTRERLLSARNSNVKVNLTSKYVPVYLSDDESLKMMVSSISFKVCNNHWMYLDRTISQGIPSSSCQPVLGLKPQATETASKKSRIFHPKDNVAKIKLESSDDK